MTKFKLLALDVDGTLLGPDGLVGEAMRRAITKARMGGLAVCLATGRSYLEARDVWRNLRLAGPHEPMVTVGGALVCQSDTGRTLYHRSIPRDVVGRFGAEFNRRGYVAMALVDGWRFDVDYVVTDAGDHHSAAKDWFAKMSVRVLRVASLAAAPGAMGILRVSAVVPGMLAGELAAELREQFAGKLNIHAILAPNYGVTIVEAHAIGADKMTALRYVGQPMLIGAGQIAAVGDDINDVPMVRGAGLGAAMGHAPDALKSVAKVIVPCGNGSGEARAALAEFIERLAAGEYDAQCDAASQAT